MQALHCAAPILAYLKRQKMTQKDFAALVGVSQPAVSQWISGSKGIDIRTAHRIEERTRGRVSVRHLFPRMARAA